MAPECLKTGINHDTDVLVREKQTDLRHRTPEHKGQDCPFMSEPDKHQEALYMSSHDISATDEGIFILGPCW